jgi:hypothetical protein
MLQDMKKRIWCPVLMFIAFFLVYEVELMVNIENMLQNPSRYNYDIGTYISKRFYGINSRIDIVFVCGAAFVCAISGFAYLHSRVQLDTYHSMPVSRFKLFISKYVSGILQFAVPFVIHMLVCIAIMSFKNVYNSSIMSEALTFTGIRILIFMLVYVVSIVAVCLTGNIIISMLGAAVLFCYSEVISLLVKELFDQFMITFTDSGFKEKWGFSPLSMIVKLYSVESDSYDIAVTKYNSSYVPVIILAIIVYTIIAAVLYQKRASDAAGKAIAFKWAEPVIKTMCVVPFAFYSGLFFYSLVSYDEPKRWFVFGLIFGYVIFAFLMEIIFRMDIKGIFRHKKQFVFNAVCTALIFIIFRYDVLGYNTYVPEDSQLQSCAVSIGLMSSSIDYRREDGTYGYINTNDYRLENMEIQGNPSVMELARKAAKEKLDNKNGDYQSIIMAYKLINGKVVYRRYYIDTKDEETMSLLADVFNDYDYKIASIPTLREGWNIEYTQVQCQNKFRSEYIAINDELRSKLLEAYQSDFVKLKFETVLNTIPLGTVMLCNYDSDYAYDSYTANYTRINSGYLLVYPDFENTINLLKENGFDFCETISADDVEKIAVTYRENIRQESYDIGSGGLYYESSYYSTSTELEDITDKAQIQEVLDNVINNDLCWQVSEYTDFCEDKTDSYFEMSIVAKDEIGSNFTYYFKKGCVPDFMEDLK